MSDSYIPPVPLSCGLIQAVESFVIMVFGNLGEFLRRAGILRNPFGNDRKGYVSLYQDFARFYNHNIFRRFHEAGSHIVCSVPGAKITIIERETCDMNWHFRTTGRKHEMINMASYNYLGFADNEGLCTDWAEKAVYKYGLAAATTRQELGTLDIHNELEQKVARYLGVEDSLVVGMGFATNSTVIPALIGPGCLIISDEHNHASIVMGCCLSGAKVKRVKHNDMAKLEKTLEDAIGNGQPRTHRPWKKIIIMVEGVYSMEGTMVDLPKVIALKKKYKAYLYLDEAHSIGAVGPNGRGVVDFYGCDPKDVDVLMGTFTKSFGASGGYIAGTKKLISHLRRYTHSSCYSPTMPGPVAAQALAAMRIMTGQDGTDLGALKFKMLADNALYFRNRLNDAGLLVLGSRESPVVPIFIFTFSNLKIATAEFAKRGIAIICAPFPAVPIGTARIRFCLSAAHTREMLDKVIDATIEIGDKLGFRFPK